MIRLACLAVAVWVLGPSLIVAPWHVLLVVGGAVMLLCGRPNPRK